MKWSLDTHKFVSEIVRSALQTIVNRKITGQSGEPEIKAAEQELLKKVSIVLVKEQMGELGVLSLHISRHIIL